VFPSSTELPIITRNGTITFTNPPISALLLINGYAGYIIRLKTTTNASSVPTAYFVTPTSRDSFSVYSQYGDNANAPALYVNKYGTVGIGNTGSAYKLDITGNGNISTNLRIGGTFTLPQGASAGKILQSRRFW